MALFVLVMTVPFPMGQDDTFLQILTGEYITKHGIPHGDPFSYTTGDRPYTEHEWLSCVLFYLVYTSGGIVGMVALKTALASLAYFFTYKTARCLGASLDVITLAFGPLVYLVSTRVTERPHLFSMMFLSLYALLFFRVRRDQLAPRWLWAIPLLHVLWTNMHGGWIQGTALVMCFALGEVVHRARARYGGVSVAQALPRRTVLTLIALVPLCTAASFVNPYGLALVLHPLHQTSLRLFMTINFEWMPVHRVMYYTPQFVVYLVYLTALWGAWFVGRPERRRPTQCVLLLALGMVIVGLVFCSLQPPALDAIKLSAEYRDRMFRGEYLADVSRAQAFLQVGLYALLGLWILCAGLHWRTMDATQAGMVLVFVFLSLRYARAMPDAALGTFPVLTATLSAARGRGQRVALGMGSGLLLALVGYVLLWGIPQSWTGLYTHKALGLWANNQKQPVCAVAFVARHRLTGHAFVSVSAAPYLLLHQWPAVQVNIDTRDYVYGEQHYRDTWAARKEPTAMAAYLQRFPSNFMLMQTVNLHRNVHQYLRARGWILVHLEDKFMVLVPRTSETAALIQAEGYHHIVPWDNRDVTAANARAVLDEAERALTGCPGRADFAWSYKAKALHAMGRLEEAALAGRNIPKQLILE